MCFVWHARLGFFSPGCAFDAMNYKQLYGVFASLCGVWDLQTDYAHLKITMTSRKCRWLMQHVSLTCIFGFVLL